MSNRLRSYATKRVSGWAAIIGLLAAALLLLSLAQIAYRFTLPTDGWLIVTDEVEDANWIYWTNLVGAPSPLQRNDMLLAAAGQDLSGTATSATLTPPAQWAAGRQVEFTVRRGDEILTFPVPIVHWTPAAFWRYNAGELSQFAGLLGGILFLAVGWFTFWRRSDVPSARALLLLSTANGAAAISGILPDGLSVQFNAPAFMATMFFSYLIFGTVLAPSLLSFSLLFPRPKGAVERRPWLAALPFAFGLLLFICIALTGQGIAGWISTLSIFAAAIASFIHAGLTQRDPVSRAQLRWALSGLALGLSLFMLNFPVAFQWVTDLLWIELFSVLASLGSVVVGIGLAVAVLRYRLWDIDVIIRKTLVYAAVTAALGLVYFGSVLLLQLLFGRVAGEQSPLAIVLSTLIIAALFSSLRQRVQASVDQRFYRSKYDAGQALAAFAAKARDEVDLDSLTAAILLVVEETMQPEQVSLWLKAVSTPRGDGAGPSGGLAPQK